MSSPRGHGQKRDRLEELAIAALLSEPTISDAAAINLAYAGTTRLATSNTGIAVTGEALATTYIGVNSSTLPTTGGVRLPLNVGVHTRSTGGTSVNLLTLDGSDIIQIGQTTSINALTASAANTITLAVSAGTRFSANGTGIGFYTTSPVAKPTVTGSRGGIAALASLLTALSGQGLLTDSSSA